METGVADAFERISDFLNDDTGIYFSAQTVGQTS